MCFNLLGSWLGVPGLKFGVQGLGPKLKVHGLGFRSLATDAVSAQEFYILFSLLVPSTAVQDLSTKLWMHGPKFQHYLLQPES